MDKGKQKIFPAPVQGASVYALSKLVAAVFPDIEAHAFCGDAELDRLIRFARQHLEDERLIQPHQPLSGNEPVERLVVPSLSDRSIQPQVYQAFLGIHPPVLIQTQDYEYTRWDITVSKDRADVRSESFVGTAALSPERQRLLESEEGQALVERSFDFWEGSSEDVLLAFSYDTIFAKTLDWLMARVRVCMENQQDIARDQMRNLQELLSTIPSQNISQSPGA